MKTGTFYLNNHGSRWICLTNGKKDKITLKTKSGASVTRTPMYFESFGNFSSALIRYKGKKVSVLMDTILED